MSTVRFPVFGLGGLEGEFGGHGQPSGTTFAGAAPMELPRDRAAELQAADQKFLAVLKAINPELFAAHELVEQRKSQVKQWEEVVVTLGRRQFELRARVDRINNGAIATAFSENPFLALRAIEPQLQDATEQLATARAQLKRAQAEYLERK